MDICSSVWEAFIHKARDHFKDLPVVLIVGPVFPCVRTEAIR